MRRPNAPTRPGRQKHGKASGVFSILSSSARASGLAYDETRRTNHGYHDAMILCQTAEKKPGEPTGREALIKGIERKILFVIVGAYPGNAPLCWRHLWADIYKVGLLNIVWQCLFSG